VKARKKSVSMGISNNTPNVKLQLHAFRNSSEIICKNPLVTVK